MFRPQVLWQWKHTAQRKSEQYGALAEEQRLALEAHQRRLRPALPAGSRIDRDELDALVAMAEQRGVGLDLTGLDLTSLDMRRSQPWRNLVFGDNPTGSVAILRQTVFAGATLEWCWLSGCELDGSNFTGCSLADCDLRFVRFGRARLGSAIFERCDLFGASMQSGTVLSNAKFRLVSPPTIFDGVTGLRWSAFEGTREVPALIAESKDYYPLFLERTELERPGGRDTVSDAVARRLYNAANSYRLLSGHWTAQTQFADAATAYQRSRRLERRAASPFFRGPDLRPFKWIGLWISDLVCGFGESVNRVLVTLMLVALLPGLMLFYLHGVRGAHDLPDDLLFSASRLTAATPAHLSPSDRLVSWLGVAQAFVGIALLGLFGFVAGNAIRRS